MDIDKARLSYNLKMVQEKIVAAAMRVGRDPSKITLVAVTKTVSAATIQNLAELGVMNIGENRVQDAYEKFESMQKNINLTWHMIGHLQTNKVKQALEIFSVIHSVDSFKLAQEIDRVSLKMGKPQIPLLLEVNTSGEESKFGMTTENIKVTLKEIASLSNIEVKGLMTMAPLSEDPQTCRVYFKKLSQALDELKSMGLSTHSLNQLSMGMSQDFEVAIEEGATMVRVGSALFV